MTSRLHIGGDWRRASDADRSMKVGMKASLAFILSTFFMASGGVAATNCPALVQIDSREFGDTNCLMKIVEFERGTNTSKLRLTNQRMGTSVGSSMFIARGFYETAKVRGAEYFINLKEWDDGHGGRIYIAGFTNRKDADLKNEFGAEYNYENDYGQKRGYVSVSDFKMLFDRRSTDIEPSGPANRTQPVRPGTNHPSAAAGSGR